MLPILNTFYILLYLLLTTSSIHHPQELHKHSPLPPSNNFFHPSPFTILLWWIITLLLLLPIFFVHPRYRHCYRNRSIIFNLDSTTFHMLLLLLLLPIFCVRSHQCHRFITLHPSSQRSTKSRILLLHIFHSRPCHHFSQWMQWIHKGPCHCSRYSSPLFFSLFFCFNISLICVCGVQFMVDKAFVLLQEQQLKRENVIKNLKLVVFFLRKLQTGSYSLQSFLYMVFQFFFTI
jgi:hypothetical protein